MIIKYVTVLSGKNVEELEEKDTTQHVLTGGKKWAYIPKSILA